MPHTKLPSLLTSGRPVSFSIVVAPVGHCRSLRLPCDIGSPFDRVFGCDLSAPHQAEQCVVSRLAEGLRRSTRARCRGSTRRRPRGTHRRDRVRPGLHAAAEPPPQRPNLSKQISPVNPGSPPVESTRRALPTAGKLAPRRPAPPRSGQVKVAHAGSTDEVPTLDVRGVLVAVDQCNPLVVQRAVNPLSQPGPSYCTVGVFSSTPTKASHLLE